MSRVRQFHWSRRRSLLERFCPSPNPHMRASPRFLALSYRRAVAVAALVAHLFAATGLPVPSLRQSAAAKGSSASHPCQDRPCGCATSEQAWGDCCCSTRGEKLAWAAERGITPPATAQPTREPPKPSPKPKKSCCEQTKEEPAPAPAKHSCCEEASEACCESTPRVPECHEQTKPEPRKPESSQPVVQWVVVALMQKCRGEGPAGLLKIELLVSPDLTAAPHAVPPPRDFAPVRLPSLTDTSHQPPTPPPRLS